MGEITLDRLTKEFGDVVAVDEVSLDIADGEFLVLVGPSGCGKSTTLRMIAGLESVTDGDVYIAGDHMNYRVPQNRDIAMVFQDYALYPHMTVRGNLGFGLESEPGYTKEGRLERVEEIAATLDIADLLDRKPGELSGGQQQRVALGRAIVREPEVFLMDEPLSNLDAKLRAEMRTELQRLQEDLDTTTVYVTHDQTEAMTMGDRIAILDDGRLQQVGTPLDCYHQPNNRFVAGFVGEPSMNFFDVERQGTRLLHHGDGDVRFEYPLSDDTRDALGDHTDLVLGIRPEDIELVAGRDGPHDFETVVDVVEPMGNENNVYLAFDEDGDANFVATVSGMRAVQAGQPVVAHIPEDAIHVFDRETGDALRNRSLDELDEEARRKV